MQWRAANYLSVGQIYLYDNPFAQAAAHERTHQAAPPRSLGDDARLELYLRSLEPDHQEARPRYDLRHRPRTWWSRLGRECLPRRNLQRGLPERFCRRGRHEEAVHAVLVPWRYP